MTKKSKTIRVNHLLRLGICVALIALIALVGVVMTSAEEVKYSEGLKFTSNGDGTCSVSGIGSCTDIVVNIPPTSPEGDAVTSIGYAAFSHRSSLTSITIPNSVTSISNYAIYNCSSLTSITIPEGVTSIGVGVFSDCNNLICVVIPDSVISMGKDAFKGCSKVIETYNGLKYVDKWVVGYVSGITEAVFRQDTVGIADWAFFDCDSLTNISIPQSVTNIGMYAFDNCSNLLSVIIPECVTRIDDGTFSACENLKSIHIPEGVTSIGDNAFTACRGLTSINIPENVTSIGEGAFSICEKITSIYIPKNVNSIGDSAFGYCYNLRRIDVSDGNIRYHSSGNCLIDSLHKTIIAGCRNSTIPKDGSVIHIGDYAFCGCHYLSSITIPDCVTSIGDYAFQYCSSLTRIHIPKDVVYISSYAFGCANLSRITVAEENPVYHSAGNCLIETASKTLVAGCYNSTIPADGSVTSIDDYAFYGRKKMTNIVIPESVISIGNEAFNACKGLTSIIIPAGVKSIGYSAFSDCGSLKSITIPEGVTNIGKYTFIGCSSLESVTIPKSVTSIGDFAFYFCENLTDIAIPDGVKYIGISTFGNCSSLTSITIPYSVKSIGTDAFAGCESLADVHFGATKNEWRRIKISEGNDKLLCATFHFLNDYFDLTSASLTLGDSLTMNYYAKADPAYSDVKMRFTYRGRIESVRGVPTETEGEYVFSLKGIAPQCMGENIKAELIYVTEDGTEIVVDVKETYSIRQYCDDALAANPENEALATLLADLLAYGDASQSYTGFNADTPVSDGFPVAPSEWENVTDTDFTLSDKTRDDIRFTSAGVRFGYVNRLYFKIKAADLTGVTLTVNGKTYTAEDLALVEDTADTYIFYTDAIYATEFDKIFTAELSVDGDVIQTLTYSVKSYVYAKQNTENDKMAALARALYNYGRSAVAYKQEQ